MSATHAASTPLRIGDVLTPFNETLGSTRVEPPVLTLTERNGFIAQEDRFNKRLATTDVSKYKVIRQGDFAFNPYLLWAGALAQNDRFETGLISPLYPTFSVNDGYESKYLKHILLAPPMVQKYDSIAFGSVPRRRRSSVKDFLNLTLPVLPPLDEQRRIAAMLDKATATVETIERGLRYATELPTKLFAQRFEARHDEPFATLPDVLTDGLANGLSPANDGTFPGRVLTLSAISKGVFHPEESKEVRFAKSPGSRQVVRENSFLITRGSGNPDLVGIGALAAPQDDDLVFPDTVMGGTIDLNIAAPEYVAAAWNSRPVRAQIEQISRTTNGTFKVNQSTLSEVRFPLPSRTEQERFAEIVRTIQRHIRLRASMQELAQSTLKSLESRAFRGEL